MQTHRHQADILIIGGGVCGLNAALTAREQGRSVIVMDKAVIERSGHIAGGIDHFLAYMDTGAEWDTREAYLEFTGKSARGVTNIDVVDSVYCQELPHALKRFEEINCTLRQPDGTYYRTKSYGQPGPWWINFNGKRMKPLLATAARKAGCAVLDRVVTADLLTNGGTVCGAAGFDIRTGDFHIIRAGAVIISTGGTNRLYSNPSGMSFNTWMCPADTGDGEAMSLRAGAELANIEFLRMTVVPRSFNAAGLNALSGMGAVLINAKGEAFMDRYHPLGMKGPRYKMVQGVLNEMREGRGPVYMDCRGIAPEAQKHLIATLSCDKDSFKDYFEQLGIDLTATPMEVDTSEGMQGGPNEVCGSGVKINKDCGTNVPGLYAGGNGADQCRSLHMAVTSGIHAGRMAAHYCASLPSAPEPDEAQIQRIHERVYAPLDPERSIGWKEFEMTLQRILTEGAGPCRTEKKLLRAKEKLEQVQAASGLVGAKDLHDLLRLHEVHNLLTIGRCTVDAALYRQESRFGNCHFREDFPEQDDERFLGQVVVSAESDGKLKLELRRTDNPYA